MCCTSYKLIPVTLNISIQTRIKNSFRCYPMRLRARFWVAGVFKKPWNKATMAAKEAQKKQGTIL